MRQRAELVVRRTHRLSSRDGRVEAVELVTSAPPRYRALLWPRAENVSSLFRSLTLPVRILPVAILWATSRPARLLIAAVLGVVSAVLLNR